MRIPHGVHRMARRGLRIGMLSTVVAGLTAAAATPAAKPSMAATALKVWYATDDPTEAPVIQALAAGFQASHPGVQVQLSTYALDDMNAKMQLALSSGHTPDLIYTT